MLHRVGRAWILCASLVLDGVGGFLPAMAETPESANFLIENALVVDGTGGDAYLADVRLRGEVIVAVGDLQRREREATLDAQGLVLSPGFIDTHSHHDGGLLEHRDALPLLTQGITTAVFGQDGFHRYPLADFLADFDAQPAAVNVASYVGHNTLRGRVLNEGDKRPAEPAEVDAMREILRDELRAGALGLSTGLEYEPGIYSQTAEVIALAQAAADLGRRYISHMRSEDRWLWEAVEETIAIGRATGMPVQISHIKLAAKSLWGQSDRLLARLEEARREGIRITADVYPYEYWQSTLWVLLPERDPDDLEEIAFVLDELTPADGIIFTMFAPDPSYVNLSVADIAARRGTSPVQTVSDLLKEARAWSEAHDGKAAESIMGRSMAEGDIEAFLGWDNINICSDGGYRGHPRGHGAFSRVLARYVRDRGVMTLEEAVAAMTGRAADHLGLQNRGRIAPGYRADLLLFDPQNIQDRAGIRDGQRLSTGITRVWVNGQLVLDAQRPTGAMPGRVLRAAHSEG